MANTGIPVIPRPLRHLRLIAVTCLIVAYSAGVILCSGCTGEQKAIDFQLNLNMPEIDGKSVTVNGGVVAPVERIQWDWGDGQIDKHGFFPATHIYKNPGTYTVTVTVFDARNTSSIKSVTVDIR